MIKLTLSAISLFFTLTSFLSPSSLNTWKAPLLAPGQLLFDGQFWSVPVYDQLYDQTLFGGLQLGLARNLQLKLSAFYVFPAQESTPSTEIEVEESDKIRHMNLFGELLIRPRNDLELALSFQQADDTYTHDSLSQRGRWSESTERLLRKFTLQGHWFSLKPRDPESLPYTQDAFNRPLLDPGQWRISSGLSMIRKSDQTESRYVGTESEEQSWHRVEANYWQLSLGAGFAPLSNLQLETDLFYVIPFTQTDVTRNLSQTKSDEWNDPRKFTQVFSYRFKGTLLPSELFRFSAEYRYYKAKEKGGYGFDQKLNGFLISGSYISRSSRQMPLNVCLDALSSPLLDKGQIKLDGVIRYLFPEFATVKNSMYQIGVAIGLMRNLQAGASWRLISYEEPMAHGQYEFMTDSRFSFDIIARLGKRMEFYLILKPIAKDQFHVSFLDNGYWNQPFVYDPENWMDPEKAKFCAGIRLFL